jgi:hypothetical protein
LTFGVLSWSLVAAVVLALALRADFRRVASVRVRAWYLPVIALAMKLGLTLAHAPATRWAQPVVLLLVLVAAALNWRLPGILVLAAGLFLNLAVVAANAGAMPFPIESYLAAGKPLNPETGQPYSSTLGRPEDPDSRLVWLDDRIPFPPTRQIISVGDVLIIAGGVWLVLGVSRPALLAKVKAPKPFRLWGLSGGES